jgi:hypothetical protein
MVAAFRRGPNRAACSQQHRHPIAHLHACSYVALIDKEVQIRCSCDEHPLKKDLGVQCVPKDSAER